MPDISLETASNTAGGQLSDDPGQAARFGRTTTRTRYLAADLLQEQPAVFTSSMIGCAVPHPPIPPGDPESAQ